VAARAGVECDFERAGVGQSRSFRGKAHDLRTGEKACTNTSQKGSLIVCRRASESKAGYGYTLCG
jgi:hypothetical protein